MRAGAFCYLRFLLAFAACAAIFHQSACATVLPFHEAMVVVTVEGVSTSSHVQLPYHWDQKHSGQKGQAHFELTFDLDESPQVPFGLFIPRLGNAYEVWLNDVLLQRKGDLRQFDTSDYSKIPHYVTIPASLLRHHNLLQVRIRADTGRKGGLGAMAMGPDEEVFPLYYKNYRARGTGSLIVTIVSVLIALVAFALWVTQLDLRPDGRGRRDPLYLIAGVAELFWALRVGDTIVENPPLPWLWWGVLIVSAAALWAIGMALVCLLLAGWDQTRAALWVRAWLATLFIGSLACGTAALGWGQAWALSAWYALAFFTFSVFLVVFVWSAIRNGSTPHRLMAMVMVLNVVVGLRDLYALRFSAVYGSNSYQRFSALLFGVVLAYVVIERFRAASTQARDLTTTLEQRITQKEAELAQTYLQLEGLAREQERGLERSRILRDMHDGVGSHISVAMRQLQSGKATDGQVLQTLRESLDHLKLSIDAMNVPPGDISALLANLRYRLEPRLKAADIQLQWDVDLIEPLEWLDNNAMRQLQFMVYEALSNVLQHAKANTVRIALAPVPQGLRLRIVDDGCGFDVSTAPHKGLVALRTRAMAVGGTVHIHSEPGNTVLEILLA
jgi:signal transduction histidine kinase